MLLDCTSQFPPAVRIKWFNLIALVVTPALALYGVMFVPFQTKTLVLSAFYYVYSMLGVTAGYHRLWSHRSYNASVFLQYFLILAGTSAVQGSCFWWARGHRSHHRHTDTDLDPYNSKRGLLWTHLGWMVLEAEQRPGAADISDLQQDPLVQWQHRHFVLLMSIFGYTLPAVIAGTLWGDWKGGFFFAGTFRLTMAHHSTFCINSLAHWLGSTHYDDRHTPRDHIITAVLTMGEGYHNFHHQFPMDYRSAFKWYQYDPTKWFIAACYYIGLASHLRVFPTNEIEKGALTMKLKQLKDVQDSLVWPLPADSLPVVTWNAFQEESKSRLLILVAGFIHDASAFTDQHPGGSVILTKSAGKDMTTSFFGGVYAHSHAAHNLLAMMRIGVLAGGVETPETMAIPPSQKLFIAENLKAQDVY